MTQRRRVLSWGVSLERIGRYEIREIAGAGGFATVFEAWDPRLETTVAVKLLARNWTVEPEVRRRFRTEAVLLRRLRNADPDLGLVQVFDIDETDDREPFIVMEWANRGTIAERARLDGWPASAIAPVARSLADTLGRLHDEGIVHRDIKPSNLLVTSSNVTARNGAAPLSRDQLLAPDERLLLGDFGLAKDLRADATSISLVAGTDRYMAPELYEVGKPFDHRVDVFAASALVAELLTGPTPDQVSSPASRPAGLPPLPAALQRGLSASPDNRQASMAQWWAELQGALVAPDESTPETVTGAMAEPAPLHRGSRKVPLVIGALVVVAIAAVAAWLGLRDSTAISGPATLESGEVGVYRVDGASPGATIWTDPSGGRTVTDVFEVRGRIPGRIELQARAGGQDHELTVTVIPAPAGPVITGPDRVSAGEVATFTVSAPAGTTVFWLHPTRGQIFADEVTVDSTTDYVIAVIARDADGIERADQKQVRVE